MKCSLCGAALHPVLGCPDHEFRWAEPPELTPLGRVLYVMAVCILFVIFSVMVVSVCGSPDTRRTSCDDDCMNQLEHRKVQVVTLCGSTRFRDAFEKANAQLTMAGRIVLSVGFFHHGETPITPEQKFALDQLHFAKINMSDGIYVLNCAGYIGQSTRREVAYAIHKKKELDFLEPQLGRTWLEDPGIRHILGEQVASFAQGKVPPL